MGKNKEIMEPRSRFLRVKCLDCESDQVIFGCASTLVKCNVCGRVLAEPTSGKTNITTRIVAVLG
jgi:small subunit ribosomal protein S27e